MSNLTKRFTCCDIKTSVRNCVCVCVSKKQLFRLAALCDTGNTRNNRKYIKNTYDDDDRCER